MFFSFKGLCAHKQTANVLESHAIQVISLTKSERNTKSLSTAYFCLIQTVCAVNMCTVVCENLRFVSFFSANC